MATRFRPDSLLWYNRESVLSRREASSSSGRAIVASIDTVTLTVAVGPRNSEASTAVRCLSAAFFSPCWSG
jgi:hypothetical protein